jgi:hypothetical protein
MFHQPTNHSTTGWFADHTGLLRVMREITFDGARVPGQKHPVVGYQEPSASLLIRKFGLVVDDKIVQLQISSIRLNLQCDRMGTGGERLR